MIRKLHTDYKNVIGIDFQGWPVYKMNLREILSELGAQFIKVGDQSFLALNNEEKILDAFPVVLDEDGMGYGVNERFITSANSEIYQSHNSDYNFNFFVEPFCPKEVEKFRQSMERVERIIEEQKGNQED